MGETENKRRRNAENQKRRRAEKGDLIRAQRKAIYWKDPEGNRAKSRAYYAEHKEHAAELARRYRAESPEVFRARKRQAAYGLTQNAFRELWNLQAGRCAICLCRLVDDGSRHTHVDHDHTTGEVRGLLCADCNVALGRFKDDPVAMRRAADYVELGRLAPRSVLSNGRDSNGLT